MPSELLLRFLLATPEQQAAIERILGWPGERGSDHWAVSGHQGDGKVGQVFRLFGELLGMGTELKASPARVFDLMVFKKWTKAETAVECKCAASLITKRVALIEEHFQMPMEQLLTFASDLKERLRTVKGDRYARKKRGGMPDEPSQYDDEGTSPKEDDDGYLPEERPD